MIPNTKPHYSKVKEQLKRKENLKNKIKKSV